MNARWSLVVPAAVMIGAAGYAQEGASAQGLGSPVETPLIAPVGAARVQPIAAIAGSRVIVCRPNVQQPHNSSHVRGTINVVSTVTCTQAVASIAVRTALYRNRKRVRMTGARYFPNSRLGANNAAVPCRPGTYLGAMSWTVRFPPGYVPAVVTRLAWGDTRKLSC